MRTLRDAVRLVVAALSWLTRLPLPATEWREGDLRRALGLFPLAGALVGGAAGLVRWAAEPWWGAGAATVAAVLAAVVVTGALHEDGLADVADGFWGGGTPERRLAIMRDSRVGTYGVLAVTGALGLRVALVAPLETGAAASALVAAHALARGAIVVAAAVLPASPGSSAALVSGPGSWAQATAGFTTAALLFALWGGAGATAALAAGGAALAGLLLLARRRLGGLTGDVCGAVAVTVEVAALAALAAVS